MKRLSKVLFFFFFLFFSAQIVCALGVSPPRIVLGDVVKETTIEKSIVLSDVGVGNIVRVTVEDGYEDWVKIVLGETFVAYKDRFDFPIELHVPPSTPNGNYTIKVEIVSTPDSSAGGVNSATLSSGVLVELRFSVVGDQVEKWEIINIEVPQIEKGISPTVIMTIDNQGSIYARPESVQLVIKEKITGNVIYTGETQDITAVGPYSIGDSVATFPYTLEPDLYFADITVQTYSGIKEKKDLPFDVLTAGTLLAEGEIIDMHVDREVGKTAKIRVLFTNTGSVDMHAKLKGEIYQGADLVDTFEHEQIFVRTKETKRVFHYYDVPEPGEYLLRTQMEFLGKYSNIREAEFTSTGKKEKVDTYEVQDYLILAMSIAILLLLILLVVLVRKKGEKKK